MSWLVVAFVGPGCSWTGSVPVEHVELSRMGLRSASTGEPRLTVQLQGKAVHLVVESSTPAQLAVERMSRLGRVAASLDVEGLDAPVWPHVPSGGAMWGGKGCWYPVISVPLGVVEAFRQSKTGDVLLPSAATRLRTKSGCSFSPESWRWARTQIPNRCAVELLAPSDQATWADLVPWITPTTEVLVPSLDVAMRGLYMRPDATRCPDAVLFDQLPPVSTLP